jgi:tRNA-Thr(GGU) m(6)t(6)A37 methyltransferase TsaA
MKPKNIRYNPIGIIHSPFKEIKGMPIQPLGAKGVKGFIEMDPAVAVGLEDLEGFSHLILLYHFHLSSRHQLRVMPFLDNQYRGIFATRAPNRPNPIGLSVVKLKAVEGVILHIEDVDILEGTPLLDIKPYVPAFDALRTAKIGWLAGKFVQARRKKSDGRFAGAK